MKAVEVDWRDRGQVRAWLETRPRDEIIAFAARAALRVAPVLFPRAPQGWLRTAPKRDDLRRFDRYAPPAWRAMLVASTAGGSGPAVDADLRGAANAAANAAADAATNANAFAATAANAFAAAASAATNANAFAATNANAFAAAAANAFAAAAANATASAATNDAAVLERQHSAAALLARPLWPEEVPEDVANRWRAQADYLAAQSGQHWRPWIDWYEDRLIGKPLDLALHRRIALIPDEDWQKGPAHVNPLIAKMVEENGGWNPGEAEAPIEDTPVESDTAPEPNPIDTAEAALAQLPASAAPADIVFENNRFEARPPPQENLALDFLSPAATDAIAALKHAGDRLLARTDNKIDRRLSGAIEVYLQKLQTPDHPIARILEWEIQSLRGGLADPFILEALDQFDLKQLTGFIDLHADLMAAAAPTAPAAVRDLAETPVDAGATPDAIRRVAAEAKAELKSDAARELIGASVPNVVETLEDQTKDVESALDVTADPSARERLLRAGRALAAGLGAFLSRLVLRLSQAAAAIAKPAYRESAIFLGLSAAVDHFSGGAVLELLNRLAPLYDKLASWIANLPKIPFP